MIKSTVAMVTLFAVPDIGLLAQLLHLRVDVLLHGPEVVLDGAAPRGRTDQGTAKTHHHFLEATAELEWESCNGKDIEDAQCIRYTTGSQSGGHKHWLSKTLPK